MRRNLVVLQMAAVAVGLLAASGSVQAADPSAECAKSASTQGLSGAQRNSFVAKCLKGPMAATKPTAPTAQSKEAQAITKPSGVDRTTRTRQCAKEADRKGLAGKSRSAFQLSCLATAGPPSEGETAVQEPHPANQIKGIGVNNYKPSSTTAKSSPQ